MPDVIDNIEATASGEPPESTRFEHVDLQSEMQRSYLDFSMSVIVSRALPDVRDGLKPVHRRVLYSMYDGGYRPDRNFSKSARVVGDVMGSYHPHGDSAIYDALVRLAQPWSLRYPLVQGQGNFGSPGNDPPAAQRYTECRMAQLAMETVIRKLEKGERFGTYLRTENGYKITAPEGYVAIQEGSKAVKLVDRLTFSVANFNVEKNWVAGDSK